MKLSDAIRKGATMRPQGFFRKFTSMGTCALGAAMDGIGLARDHAHKLYLHFPELDHTVDDPICGLEYPLHKVIALLNDRRGWSREKIAGWLDEFELCVTDVEAPAEPVLHASLER